MSRSRKSRPSAARRISRTLLVAAWALLLLGIGATLGYLAFGPPAPDMHPRAELHQTLPPPPEPSEPAEREVATPPATPLEGEDGGDRRTAASPDTETGETASPTTGAADTAPPPVPDGESTAAETASPPPPPPPAQDAEDTAPAPGERADDAASSGQAPMQLMPEDEGAEADASTGGSDGAGDTQTARAPAVEVREPDDAPAWQRYARRLTPPDGLPKIAVVVRGLGLSSAASEAAVTRLPGAVSLSFSPYARAGARAWAARARRQGHEVLIDLPMEPSDYPARDPGPRAMMTSLTRAQNLERLDWLLAQADQEVGVVGAMGSAFLTEPKAVEPVLRELKARGLMYLDNGAVRDNAALELARALDLPHAVNDRTLDGGQVSRPAIEARLVEAERVARQDGLAVVLARPFPVTIDVIEEWTRRLEQRGFVLVPATYAAIRRAGAATANLR